MNTKHSIALAVALIALLISACAPSAAAQPSAPTIQSNLPPTSRPVARPEPAKATATAQPVDRTATQQAFYRDQDQKVMAATAAASTGPDHFSGVWAGTMSFSDDASRKEDIQVVVVQGCAIGGVCGYIDNLTVQCKWEMTLANLQGNVLEYKFSKTLSGDCPARGGGKLTMQADGTLLREHKTPDFTASGPLTKQK